MALVSYDYDDSGSENDEEGPTSSAVIIHKNTETPSNGEVPQIDTSEKLPEILSHLPKTKEQNTAINVLEDKLEDFVPKYQPVTKKERKPQKVKITIPALSEFDEEDDEPEKKKRKSNVKGSNLLSMLPPVKGSPLSTKSFVPNVLKNKPKKPPGKTNALMPHVLRKKAEEAKKAAIKKITKLSHGSDTETDDEELEIPETFDDEMWHKVCGPKSKSKPPIIKEEVVVEAPVINIAPETVQPYEGLDNEAFKQLVGKAKRPVNIKLVDINEEEIVSERETYVAKSLTDPDQAPKEEVEDPCDPTRRKKHHITFLAEQAKLNEQELQGQWSANKFTRNQTRAKYGF